jgi:hypothetical protein
MSQVVEHLLSKCKALSSTSCIAKEEEGGERGGGGGEEERRKELLLFAVTISGKCPCLRFVLVIHCLLKVSP